MYPPEKMTFNFRNCKEKRRKRKICVCLTVRDICHRKKYPCCIYDHFRFFPTPKRFKIPRPTTDAKCVKDKRKEKFYPGCPNLPEQHLLQKCGANSVDNFLPHFLTRKIVQFHMCM